MNVLSLSHRSLSFFLRITDFSVLRLVWYKCLVVVYHRTASKVALSIGRTRILTEDCEYGFVYRNKNASQNT
jgi:hypothetical protein